MDYKTLRAGDRVEWKEERTLTSPIPKKGYKEIISEHRVYLRSNNSVLTFDGDKVIKRVSYIKKIQERQTGIITLEEYEDSEGYTHYGYRIMEEGRNHSEELPSIKNARGLRVINRVQNK